MLDAAAFSVSSVRETSDGHGNPFALKATGDRHDGSLKVSKKLPTTP